ncbi:LysM domain-containing protein [Uliginosibacterium sediminicola]|uniref:LysM domain-containing protein n=1 Tax=Uliginosibacterium sediminicola TaxID=2024550 RepID=A0ABU9Z0Y5_9RHOO
MTTAALYTVRSGDTLGKIANAHRTTVNELARLNNISDPNRIAVGQVLKLSESPKAKPPAVAKQDDWGTFWAQFVDALNNPIQGLKVALHLGDERLECTTDANGCLPAYAVSKPNTPITITVKKSDGAEKTVAKLVAPAGETHARIASPKVTITSVMRKHDGATRPPAPTKPAEPGEVKETRSAGGNPVQQVSLECPNPENLKLGSNFKYRDIVIAAAKRAGVIPQAVAAIMNAEAATITIVHHIPVIDPKTKKQKIGKDGKPVFKTFRENTGEWDAKSASPRSSARGMTQFLDGTWLGMACTAGTFLNARAKKERWLTQTTIEVKKGKKTTTQTVQAFRLADDTLVTKAPLANTLNRKYVTGRAKSSDANLQKLLDLRFEPEYAIQTAVDYGMQNLKGLEAAGYELNGLSDGDKAKLMYLTHHLGLGDAKSFIQNTISDSRAEYLLKQQIGGKKADVYFDEEGSYINAHRKWLAGYIDEKIDTKKFVCAPDKSAATKLISTTDSIAKK